MANELSSLTPQLLEDFDIVTFDPRGVGQSDPVACTQAPGEAADNAEPAPSTPDQVKSVMTGYRQFAADCERTVPTLLAHVGTVDVARDMDQLRQALGDATLTYMGQSYGTLLGLTYAQLFPTHVRAMALDGVIDPALSFDQMTAQQATGFEASLSSFFAWCAGTPSCPWHWTGDPTAALLGQLASASTHPTPAGGGQVADAGALYDALLDGMYARNDWPRLAQALAADVAGNGAPVVSMSSHYQQGGSTNGQVASIAIDCLDHPVSRNVGAFGALSDSLHVSAPVFGPLLAWGEAVCAVWPAPPTRKVGPVTAAGAPPILVIGTTQDPATPYAWAVNVSHELARSALLTVDGDNHVAYFYSGCVRADVQAYLVGGVTPAPGATCSS
ncbi:MAG TPA: alpha/beta hydrolase [Acidimicrobiales bacterium]|nr:alpha/beta hydrolase [Acidimicrobiales bacterium]